MDFQAKEWSFLFRNGLIEHIGCKAGAMALSFIQCSHSHKILIVLSYYIHCYVFPLVCKYDDIPLASLIYCTFFPMCRMSGNVNTLVYFYLAVCTSVHVFIPCVFLSWNSYSSASQVVFSSYGNLTKLLNYRQLCIDFFFDFLCLTPLSTIFQIYHGDQF